MPTGPLFYPLNRRVNRSWIEKEIKRYGMHLITDSFQFKLMDITTHE